MYKRRLEDEVLAKIDYEKNLPKFFNLLTPRQLAAVALVADGVSQIGVAEALGVAGQTIQRRIEYARTKAIMVFGEEALDGRSNPRDKYQKQERR
ncbi:MAG: hypothetical protein UU93_C0010G0017 [Candidatus Amesbacteria bacterium GW2011_GWA2_42_12]|uniref:RNA polymerase sigma-70 ECF-like HTH domain-containing protein n=1 Tax=Candidatus Amesbacteria bacterium GW2011_GWA2_42_12 TaxID=1618356 RepID=A0A0G1B3M5_9BACT|nr:MAG: hypothetical protein UU93_C0010G0017 [Candidatus Amesbacteria bacterium GW2011_GWA2_42_12]